MDKTCKAVGNRESVESDETIPPSQFQTGNKGNQFSRNNELAMKFKITEIPFQNFSPVFIIIDIPIL